MNFTHITFTFRSDYGKAVRNVIRQLLVFKPLSENEQFEQSGHQVKTGTEMHEKSWQWYWTSKCGLHSGKTKVNICIKGELLGSEVVFFYILVNQRSTIE